MAKATNTAPSSLATMWICIGIIAGSCFVYFVWLYYLNDWLVEYREGRLFEEAGGRAAFNKVPNPMRTSADYKGRHDHNDYDVIDNETGKNADNDDENSPASRRSAKAAGCVLSKEDTPLILITIASSLSFIVFGACLSSLGAGLPEMADFFNQSRSNFGISFTFRGVGFLTGAMISSKIIGENPGFKINISKEAYLSMCSLLTGLSTGLMATTSNFQFFLALLVFQGLAFGGIEIAGNVIVAEIWGKRVQPWMQALHMFFGVGAIVGPSFVGAIGFRKAYMVIAIFAASPALLIIMKKLFLNSKQDPTIENDGDQTNNSNDCTPRSAPTKNPVPLSMKCLLTLFFYVYVGAESGYGGWISTYSLDTGTTVSQSQAAFLSSIFWSSLSFGRLLAIPAAVYMSATNMLRIQLVISIIGCILLVSIGKLSYGDITFATIVYGFALSSIYPLALTIVGDFGFKMDAATTGLFVLGSCSGESSVPVIIGMFMRYCGVDSFGGCIIAASVIMVLIYVTIHLLVSVFRYYDVEPEVAIKEISRSDASSSSSSPNRASI